MKQMFMLFVHVPLSAVSIGKDRAWFGVNKSMQWRK